MREESVTYQRAESEGEQSSYKKARVNALFDYWLLYSKYDWHRGASFQQYHLFGLREAIDQWILDYRLNYVQYLSDF